jgi:pyruvate,water dikinase
VLAGRVRELTGLRESPKLAAIRAMTAQREGLLATGRELVAADVLERPEDVFFLRLADLKALAGGAQRDWQALVAERRGAYEREKRRRRVPRVLLSDGTAFYEGLGATSEAGSAAIVGSPVSPGVVEGVVHVVFDPRGARLTPGEILVCPGTDPAWTPLFLAAGGLVMEVGGMMTHGSVVAREYGIPAVVGVNQATTRLQTGQRIRLDGSSGQIVVLGTVD